MSLGSTHVDGTYCEFIPQGPEFQSKFDAGVTAYNTTDLQISPPPHRGEKGGLTGSVINSCASQDLKAPLVRAFRKQEKGIRFWAKAKLFEKGSGSNRSAFHQGTVLQAGSAV